MSNVDIETLKRRLDADFDAGSFVWRECSEMSVQWNAKNAGKPAFCSLNNRGYLMGRINKKAFSAHRVAWALFYGEWPSGQIDHINGDPLDNRIKNLRIVTNAENSRNFKLRIGNKTGVSGVRLLKCGKRYVAQIKVDYKPIHLGTFACIDDAIAARTAAEAKYGFTGRARAAITEAGHEPT